MYKSVSPSCKVRLSPLAERQEPSVEMGQSSWIHKESSIGSLSKFPSTFSTKSSPYFVIPPIVGKDYLEKLKFTKEAQQKIAALEARVHQLKLDKQSLETTHSAIVKRLQVEVTRLGGREDFLYRG
jgi:hypothetical protein